MSSKKPDFLTRLEINKEKLTKSDKLIAEFMVRSYPKALLFNASEISVKVNVNASTVIRFFSKLGYKSAKNVQDEFRGQADFIMKSALDIYYEHGTKGDINNAIIKRILECDLTNISSTLGNISTKDLQSVLALIKDSKNAIYIVGERKQLGMSYYLYSQLNAARDNVNFVTSGNAPDHLLRLKAGDLLVVFDFRRYPSINKKAAMVTKSQGGKVIAFVDSPMAPVQPYADHSFLVYTKTISAFDSYTAVVSLLNVLVAITVDKFGKKFEDRYKRLIDIYSHLDTFHYE